MVPDEAVCILWIANNDVKDFLDGFDEAFDCFLPRTTEVRQRFEHRGELRTMTGKNKYKLMSVHDQANCITNIEPLYTQDYLTRA